MAKKIRFSLDMGNNHEVNTIDELREYFNLEKVISYLAEGKFITWLKDRYYETQASLIEQLDVSDDDYQEKICEILEVGWNVDFDDAESYSDRLSKLKSFTNDFKLISHLNLVAFDQFELYDRLDQGYATVYLFGETFTIPSGKRNVKYIGINNPEVKIDSPDGILLEGSNIILENVKFDIVKAAEYGNSDAQYQLGLKCEDEEKFDEAFSWYLKSANQSNIKAIEKVITCYINGVGTDKNVILAKEYAEKCNEQLPNLIWGDIYYQLNEKDTAINYYQKALDNNETGAIEQLTSLAEKGDSSVQGFLGIHLLSSSDNKQVSEGSDWCKKSLNNGNYSILKKIREISEKSENPILYNLVSDIYFEGIGTEKDFDIASMYCRKILDKDEFNPIASKRIKEMSEKGNISAQYFFARYCCKNEAEAFDYIKKAAESGYTEAQWYMGVIYFYGTHGQQRDFSLSAKWYDQSGNESNADTARMMGSKWGNHGEKL